MRHRSGDFQAMSHSARLRGSASDRRESTGKVVTDTRQLCDGTRVIVIDYVVDIKLHYTQIWSKGRLMAFVRRKGTLITWCTTCARAAR